MLLTSVTGSSAGAAVALQYHHVAADTPVITSISPTDFAAHMAYLFDHGFTVIDIATLTTALRDDRPLVDRSIIITFDDAYKDILTNALPVLMRYSYPFTVFVATELVGSSAQYLDWQDLRALSQAGATLASHTHSHTHLLRRASAENAVEWRQRVIEEITSATSTLKEKTGNAPLLLAYPYGEYNPDIVAVVNELDYVAFGQQSGAIGAGSNLAFLPRFPMSGIYGDIGSFRTKVETLALPEQQEVLDPVLPIGSGRPELHLKISKLDAARVACYGPGGRQPVTITDTNQILTRAASEVPIGRSRYNCTIPAQDGRYYWYSQLWLRRNIDGSWPAEP